MPLISRGDCLYVAQVIAMSLANPNSHNNRINLRWLEYPDNGPFPVFNGNLAGLVEFFVDADVALGGQAVVVGFEVWFAEFFV